MTALISSLPLLGCFDFWPAADLIIRPVEAQGGQGQGQGPCSDPPLQEKRINLGKVEKRATHKQKDPKTPSA